MSHVVRAAGLAVVDVLYKMAKSTGGGFTNLPASRPALRRKLEKASASFAREGDEFGGEDLLRRLAPATYRWAVLESARLAAKRVDERARGRTSDADQLVSLFRFGFAVDEQLDDRLAQLKREQPADPLAALPALAPIAKGWDRAAFEAWLSDLAAVEHTATPTGRRLKGAPPEQLPDRARALTAALRPLAEAYPAPYFRIGR